MRSVYELKGTISNLGGIATANRYEVVLPTDIGNSNANTFSILCKNVNLPGKQVLTHDRMIGLQNHKVAYGYGHEDVNMTFMLTNNPVMKRYFEEWQQMAVTTREDFPIHYPNYKEDYARDVYINKMDKNGRITYGVVLIKAFPTTVSPVELGNENEGLLELNVQLSYTRWYERAV